MPASATDMDGMNYIVSGWYTKDYKKWWDKLRPTLEAVGAPYDFVEVERSSTEWESSTMVKAAHVLQAMQRHPDKTVVFLDVDCEVLGPLDELLKTKTDFACFIETNANPKSIRFLPWSGTMVIRQTPKAYELVERWVEESRTAARYSVDQTSLANALGKVPGLTLTLLDRKWCARPWDNVADAVILHDSASIPLKTPKWKQRWNRRLHRWGLKK
jgi:hypothetical protein